MKKTYLTVAALSSVFAASCASYDKTTISVPPPEWTKSLHVDAVEKTYVLLTNVAGRHFRIVGYNGTDIGGGLVARQQTWNFSVTDSDKVTCRWDVFEKLTDCYKPLLSPK